MAKRLDDVLNGREENCLLPFLWQRGEEEAVIREEMARVHASGIGAVCVEARPHPDFYGPRWWRDMDIIMEEARARGMRVWLLDDDHFPTGHARGKMEGAPEELRRLFIKETHIEAFGPQRASFQITAGSSPFSRPGGDEPFRLLAVVAARRDPASEALTGERVELTSLVQDGVLYWDVPEGTWRVFVISLTRSGGSHQDYINMLIPESVRVLIDAVYEPVYERYRDDFGATFAGFFSDEPGFYNDAAMFDFNSSVGKPGVTLPWREDLLALLSDRSGADFTTLLPLLWHPGGDDTALARLAYMDLVSRLYGEAFTQQLGDWCRARGVEYIGHILEDNNVHARLGPSAGHFFRALWGQDMAGIDVVLWQLTPGYDEGPYAFGPLTWDGEFFHYGLAKLGSSLAHLDPKKKGRAMVELFGAYGWREGLKLMKWITDHLLVRGTNVFVPHAFSQANFPDPDCPPHLYARGKNPQYRYYHHLNAYTQRAAHLLSGGQHIAPLAVLYHAEAEWAGPAMPCHKPVKELTRAQIDCDILPADLLMAGSQVVDGALSAGSERYQGLVIPASEALPGALIDRLAEMAEQGLPLLFIDHLPRRAAGKSARLGALADLPQARVTPLDQLASLARTLGIGEVVMDEPQPNLRYLHIRQPDMDVWMLTNEHPTQLVETGLSIPGSGLVLGYDPFENRVTRLAAEGAGGRLRLDLRLEPYQSLFMLTGAQAADAQAADAQAIDAHALGAQAPAPLPTQAWEVPGPWSIATASAEAYPGFIPWQPAAGLADLSRPGALPSFSGTFRYETEFEWAGPTGGALLDLGEAYETAEVWLNDQPAGVRLCPPYRFAAGALLRQGPNRLVIEVTNTLAKEVKDFFSNANAQEPSGLIGPVRVLTPG